MPNEEGNILTTFMLYTYMDIPKSLVKNISTIRDVNWLIKSYRIFKKLEISEQGFIKQLQKDSYTIADYTLLLYAKGKKRYSLESCYKLACQKKDVIAYKLFKIQSRYSKFGLNRTSDEIQQLLFHGFIPYHELPKRFLRKGYAYITSTKLLDGIKYFYPERFYDDWAKHTKARSYQTVFEDLNLPGMMRVNYSFEYKPLTSFKL